MRKEDLTRSRRCFDTGVLAAVRRCKAELAAFDSRMRDLDGSQRPADDEGFVMEGDGLDLAPNTACPITMILVRIYFCSLLLLLTQVLCAEAAQWMPSCHPARRPAVPA